jgi:hypothetical protein
MLALIPRRKVRRSGRPRFVPCRKIPKGDQKTRHHRRPRRWGGETIGSNIVMLPRWEHDGWHRLFNHMYATSIARQINEWMFPSDRRIVCVDIRNDCEAHHVGEREHIYEHMTHIQREAWHALFGRDTHLVEICAQINARYLDPSYIFEVEEAVYR